MLLPGEMGLLIETAMGKGKWRKPAFRMRIQATSYSDSTSVTPIRQKASAGLVQAAAEDTGEKQRTEWSLPE